MIPEQRLGVEFRNRLVERAGADANLTSRPMARTHRFSSDCVPFLARERDNSRRGRRDRRTDAGQAPRSILVSCHTIMHGSKRFGLASLTNLVTPAAHRAGRDPLRPLKIATRLPAAALRVLALAPV